MCTTSRNSPCFFNLTQICDLVKCKCQNNLGMLGAFNFEGLFHVANVETIASYWYNGRLQIQLVAVSRTVNSME